MPISPRTFDERTHAIVFARTYREAMHTWAVVKAVDLLRIHGHVREADMAGAFLLPMLEGAAFCDAWGDSDLDGSQILHYYCPERQDQNYGYGSAPAVFTNASSDYGQCDFYGYENAANYAQNRYEAAQRAYRGHWGEQNDLKAGWVIDDLVGQSDPIDGFCATDAAIDFVAGFGMGQTPCTALSDLWTWHSQSQILFPQNPNPLLARVHLAAKEVFDKEPNWLKEHFGFALPVEAYNGYDGHGRCFYGTWTTDHESSLMFYVPVNAKAHAFFLLGWALHLVVDCACPAHTDDDSLWIAGGGHTYFESMTDPVLSGAVCFGTGPVRDSLPALTIDEFTALSHPAGFGALECRADYRQQWYAAMPAREYTRQLAETSHRYLHYMKQFPYWLFSGAFPNWDLFGALTSLWMDLAVKATAGVIHNFFAEVGLDAAMDRTQICLRGLLDEGEPSVRKSFSGEPGEPVSVRSKGYARYCALTDPA